MRRLFVLLAAIIFSTSLVSRAQKPELEVALTFDDLPATGATPPGVTRVQIIESILATLKAEHVPPVYGFLNAETLE